MRPGRTAKEDRIRKANIRHELLREQSLASVLDSKKNDSEYNKWMLVKKVLSDNQDNISLETLNPSDKSWHRLICNKLKLNPAKHTLKNRSKIGVKYINHVDYI